MPSYSTAQTHKLTQTHFTLFPILVEKWNATSRTKSLLTEG
ncbi:unnamed protein product, partial [Vitis vinifera]|uniref:Uncharacterized protein n=1 Tax=Vitis vinifera TaxID=29760 RepID=D7UB81_VITVI